MSNQTHYCGYQEVVPNAKAVSTKQSGPSTRNYEITNRTYNYNSQSSRYVRHTSKESYSSRDYSNRGKTVYKDEFKASSTVRVGDKGGYTEYYKQEKVTRVNYDSGNNSGGIKGDIRGGNKGKNSKGYISGGNKGCNSKGYISGGNKGCNSKGYISGGNKSYNSNKYPKTAKATSVVATRAATARATPLVGKRATTATSDLS